MFFSAEKCRLAARRMSLTVSPHSAGPACLSAGVPYAGYDKPPPHALSSICPVGY